MKTKVITVDPVQLTKYQQDDVAFVKRAGFWPRWPTLPMKKSDGLCGFLWDHQPIGPKLDPQHVSMRTVYLANPWHAFGTDGKFDLKTCPTAEYTTVEDMIADGWSVD